MRNPINSILFCLALALCHTASADVLIKSFTNEADFGYTYGSWEGQTQVSPTGVTIGGSATARGGAGSYLKTPLDLSGESSLEVTVRPYPSNAVSHFNLLLKTHFGSGDNDFYTSRYTFTLPPSSDGAFVKIRVSLDPSKATSGEFGPIKLSKVNELQIQGNYANDTDAFNLIFWEVRATR